MENKSVSISSVSITGQLDKVHSLSGKISNRIRKSRSYLSGVSEHPIEFIPYGYYLEKKILIVNMHEQCIIKFITLCKSNTIKTVQLNSVLKPL